MRMARRIGFFGMPSGIVLFDKDKGGDQTRVTGGFTGGSGSNCARINFRIGRAGCVDDSVVVVSCAVGVSALMNAAWVAEWIVAVAAEGDDLRVFVQNGIQHFH